ncbi:unnamed protein product [Brassica rapa subsp. trilocularis]
MAKYSSHLLAGSSAKNWEARNVKRRGVRMVVYMLPLPLRDASVIPTLLSDQSVSAISSRTEEASFCFYFPEAVGEHAFDRSERRCISWRRLMLRRIRFKAGASS